MNQTDKTLIEIDPAWLPAHAIDALRGGCHLHAAFSAGEKKMLRRKKKTRPSEWVAKNIVVPADSPTGKGKWSAKVTPYWVGPMDASFYPSVQEISVCAVAQTGKSQFMSNCMGYTIDRAPGNWMLVMPDEKIAGEFVTDRLAPMIHDSSRLASYKTGYVDDLTSMKIKLRHVRMYTAWATSASRMASKPLPYAILDEENKFPENANRRELTPVDLVRMRQRNFAHMRKMWRASTPTIEGVGISRAMEESEVIFDYWVRCPECGGLQLMVFDERHFKWHGGGSADPDEIVKTRAAWYECGHCRAKWDDSLRNRAVLAGKWYVRVQKSEGPPELPENDRESSEAAPDDSPALTLAPEGLELFEYLYTHNPIKIAFHVPAWISRFVSLSECVAEFIRGLNDINKFKAFCNNIKGEPWKIVKKEREEDQILRLMDDRPRGTVPGPGLVVGILAGVDTQDYGFWYELRAWAYYGAEQNKESWCVREGYVTDLEALSRVLWEDEYMDVDGNRYHVGRTLIDAAGHRTAEVYRFCSDFKNRGRIFPTFGKQTLFQGGNPYTLAGGKKGLEFYPGGTERIPGGLIGYNFNTNFYKDELSRLLSISPGDPSCWWYHAEFPGVHARHMTAEVVGEKGTWENPQQKENHLWDCAVLNLFGWDLFGVRYVSIPDKQEKKAVQRKPENQENSGTVARVRNYQRPGWLNRG